MSTRRLVVSGVLAGLTLVIGASVTASAEPRVRSYSLPDRALTSAFALTPRSFVVYSRPLVYTPVDRCRAVGAETAHVVEDLGDRFRTRRLSGTPLPIHLRLSPTRFLSLRVGPDGQWNTADDEVVIVDRIGEGKRTRSIPAVGAVNGDPFRGSRVDDDTAFLATVSGTVLLSNLGATPEVTRFDDGPLEAPAFLSRTRYLRASATHLPPGRAFFRFELGQPKGVALEPLVGDSGFEILSADRALSLERSEESAQARFRLYTGLDGDAPAFADYGLPYVWRDDLTTRLTADRRLLLSPGSDETVGGADDQLLIIDHILSTPVVTAVPVPNLRSGSRLVRLSDDAAALRTKAGPGPAGVDDVIVLLTDLGGTPEVTTIAVGPLAPIANDPTRLGPRQLAMPTLGVDGVGSADDEIAVISDIGGTNLLSHVVVGRMGALTPLGGSGVLAQTSGADGLELPTADDQLALVTAAGGLAAATSIPVPYAFQSYVGPRVPEVMGNGWSLFGPLGAPPPSIEEDGCETPLHVIDGLPGGRELATESMTLRASPRARASARLTARLVLPEPSDLAAADLTFRIGEVWQTIPASAWQATETGYRYEDASGANGFFRLLAYDAAGAELRVEGRGPLAEGARFGRRRVVVSLESEALRIAESVETVRRDGALVARRRK
jgi:hypothetical protein